MYPDCRSFRHDPSELSFARLRFHAARFHMLTSVLFWSERELQLVLLLELVIVGDLEVVDSTKALVSRASSHFEVE